MGLDRKTASRTLREIATLLELHADNPHRVRAFANAARAVDSIRGEFGALVDSGDIVKVRGIGKGTAAVLAELARGEHPAVLAELEEKTPSGVVELLRISGLGPKKVRDLWRELDVTSPGELEYACRENRLVDLRGFGPASQKRILDAVQFFLSNRERHLIHRAWGVAERVIRRLSSFTGVERAMVAGDLRRGVETIGLIEVLAIGREDAVTDAVAAILREPEEASRGSWLGVVEETYRVRVLSSDADNAGWALLQSTGTDRHLDAIGQRAVEVGLRLDKIGLWSGERVIPCPDEHALYEAIGCQWIPPELREDGSAVPLAVRNELPRLVETSDLRGALHNHTTDSDGTASVEEMARAAGALGWRHIGIGDHSPAAHYANGVDAERLRRQWSAIDELNRRADVPRVVKGLEADILPDGTLDIPVGCEHELEYVVGSIHTSFRLPRDTQTQRVISAVRHPACRILGHPTGRLLLARPGYDIDLDRVLEECAEHGVSVEINASPYRLDLDHRWAQKAIDIGVDLAINPDAHATEGLEDVRWGVMVARRAGATTADVLNCRDVEPWIRDR